MMRPSTSAAKRKGTRKRSKLRILFLSRIQPVMRVGDGRQGERTGWLPPLLLQANPCAAMRVFAGEDNTALL